MTWQFVDDNGTFQLVDPHKTSYLYFPLVNEAGMMSAVTPTLHGDSKTGQNRFLTVPVSVEDLHLSRAGRNFWVNIEGEGPWSVTGNSARQIAHREMDTVKMRGGLLWHELTRHHKALGLTAVTTNFIPTNEDTVELMQIELRNEGPEVLTFTPTAAILIYGRSADNLRDHRHVTALLHRIQTSKHGVTVQPTLTFDERGHHKNETIYAVLGTSGSGEAPVSIFPVLEDFIGEGGSLDWPDAVVSEHSSGVAAGYRCNGYEAMGGLQFAPVTLPPGEAWHCQLILAIGNIELDESALLRKYGDSQLFASHLTANQNHWQKRIDALKIEMGDASYNQWLKWVTLQPILRRLFGNSFLPYHDYGRGGRGWRDLWQDLLVLLFMEPEKVRPLLFSNFAGIRIDGSNATIIGNEPGQFVADRNNIPRVWMDHGAWPWLTTLLYLNLSGDLSFLLAEQRYFQDQFTHRATQQNPDWKMEQGDQLLTRDGTRYQGTILEHLLVQHLTAFFNTGSHNNIRMEGADWNDGLDMASEHGESVAFTALYASNLRQIAQMSQALFEQGITAVSLAEELELLLDSDRDPVDYRSVSAKQARLTDYFDTCSQGLSGTKSLIPLPDLINDLTRKSDWLTEHVRQNEWVTDQAGNGWFNAYYDNDGQQVEGEHKTGVRMTLTGQVFTLMGGVATDDQARQMIAAAQKHLWDESVGGYRLNTDFGGVLLNLGRLFGFAFGHKENGAMFTHMAVMYANALYQRGFVAEGDDLLQKVYEHSIDFGRSRMYPGLPEYVNPRGRGMYPYLTGSASWYLLTLVTEVFGVNGRLGDLTLTPKLRLTHFDEKNRATIMTRFAGQAIKIVYHNRDRVAYDAYQIESVTLNNTPLIQQGAAKTAVISRQLLLDLPPATEHQIVVTLTSMS